MAKNEGERSGFEYEADPQAGKYEKISKTCKECGKVGVHNLPIRWIKKREIDGRTVKEVNAHELPPGISAAKVEKDLDESDKDFICPNCQNKDLINKAAEQLRQQIEERADKK